MKEHYYSQNQRSRLNLKKIRIKAKGLSIELFTAAGIFSKDRLDKGTELLINECIVKPAWKILDLGCGYGVVGVVLGKIYPDAQITMADINKRAVDIAKKNTLHHCLDNVKVIHSNLYENLDGKFNAIIVNPPMHAGKKVYLDIIEKAPSYLEPHGLLQIVARHNKGGKELSKKMKEIFGNVSEVAKQSGYRVYSSEKTKSP